MKRVISLLLSASILMSFVPGAFGAEFKQNDVLSYFNSLNGYESGSNDSNLPIGWSLYLNDSNRAKLVDSAFVGNTTVMKLNNNSGLLYAFDEVVRTGKIHASFDMKLEDLNNSRLYFYGHNARVNNNPKDYFNAEASDYTYDKFLSTINGSYTLYNPATSWTPAIGAGTDVVVGLDSEWHKYDFYINIETSSYSVYIDGVQLYETLTTSSGGLKSLYFLCSGGLAYVDNIYLNHYQDETAADDMKITVDYPKGGVLCNSGTVNVAFSEAIDETLVPMISDFTVKNTVTQQEVDIKDIQWSEISGFDLTFDNLDAGEYEVFCNSEYIKGIISNTSASNTVRFITENETTGATPRYYLNETFNSYKGGMPAGWQRVYPGVHDSTVNAAYTAVTGVDGNAIDINATKGKTIMYQFDENIYAGKFTVEFDVKNFTGAWAVGLLTSAEFMSLDYISESAKTAKDTELKTQKLTEAREEAVANGETLDEAAWQTNVWPGISAAYWASGDSLETRRNDLNNRRYTNILVANSGAAQQLQCPVSKRNFVDDSNIVPGITIPQNEWSHIKVVVDMDAGTYTITANNGTPQTVAYNNDRFKNETLIHKDTGYKEFMHGIAGIRIQKGSSAERAQFDNIKVYTDTSYNAYEDFNGTSDTVKWHHGWYSPNRPTTQLAMNGVVGKSGQSGDKAAKLSVSTQTMIIHQLAAPIKAGSTFDIEFDIKADDPTKNTWALNIIDEADMYCRGNNYTGATVAPNGEPKTSVDGQYYSQNVVLTNRAQTGITDRVFQFGRDLFFYTNATTGSNNILWKDGEWQHIKFSVNNAGARTKFKLDVTYADGTTVTSQEYELPVKNVKYKTLDMYGIALWSLSGALECSIDNLKVREQTTGYKAFVSSIIAVSANGQATLIGESVPSSALKLEANLSAALESTDNLRLFYPNKGTVGGANEDLNYTPMLEDGGKKVSIVFNELPELDTYITLELGNKMRFAGTYLTKLETQSVTFKIIEEDGELVVTDFRLYEWIAGRAKADNPAITCEGAWAPVTATDLNSYSSGSQLKVIARGYNTSNTNKLFVGASDYMLDGDNVYTLAGVELKTVEIGRGYFTTELTNIPFTQNANVFKGFLWSYPELRPLMEALEYSK